MKMRVAITLLLTLLLGCATSDDTDELENEELKTKLGKVIVRGDNILYVSP